MNHLMRDQNAKTITNHALVEEMRERRRKFLPELIAFEYNWYHASTGNSGTGTIKMASRELLEAWLERWNHSGLANGWVYSIGN